MPLVPSEDTPSISVALRSIPQRQPARPPRRPRKAEWTCVAPRVTTFEPPPIYFTSWTLPSRSLVGCWLGSPGDNDGGGRGRSQLYEFGAVAAPGAAVAGVPSPHAGAGRACLGGWACLGEVLGPESAPISLVVADTPAALAPRVGFLPLYPTHTHRPGLPTPPSGRRSP